MRQEPPTKRAVVFVDGQNLFHQAREAFGHTYPSYEVKHLAEAICRREGWTLTQVWFYTGIPDASDNPRWHHFWTHKLAAMGRRGVHTFSRPLRYRVKSVRLPDGQKYTFLSGEEKGIDVRLAIDVIRLGYRREYDVAVVVSQDQDLSEVADEIRVIASEQNRWLKIASAFPDSPAARNRRGIERTDWIRIDRATYDSCLDSRDYRPKPTP